MLLLALEDMESCRGQVAGLLPQQGEGALFTPVPVSPEPSTSPQQLIPGKHRTKSLPWMTHHRLPPGSALPRVRKGTPLLDLTQKGLALEHESAHRVPCSRELLP